MTQWTRATRAVFSLAILFCAVVQAQSLRLHNGEATAIVEPYAPNIVRVTLALTEKDAATPPGYGFLAHTASDGWTVKAESPTSKELSSGQMHVHLSVPPKWTPTGTAKDISQFFFGTTPGFQLSITHPDGSTLLSMNGWDISVPSYKKGNTQILHDRRPSDPPFFNVSASFAAAADEHDYGMGQNQEGILDLRNRTLRCQHDYDAPSGQTVCVPFVVTNKGYALLWDNPSKTLASFGYHGQNIFFSEVGQRVSFFVISGKNYDDFYRGYRLLTGDTPMLPKSAYGYIQCKQRYSSQAELLAVAKGYRDRHLPIDTVVIDWFHYTKMGQLDMDPAKWPDPVSMNKRLHEMNLHVMISVWPRFTPKSRYYSTVQTNGWFMHLADGTPTNGEPYDLAGSDIDTTNPAAAKWYWSVIKQNYVDKGFDAFWADETEPDIPPNGSYFHVGPGTQYFNVYPYFHTQAFYDGMRHDMPERALILARDAYFGAQHNAAVFWSGDISPTWDVLQRQVPTGLNFVSSGMPYWSTDIGGWQFLPSVHKAQRPTLIDGSDAHDNLGDYEDYAELYVRWFEYGAFQPNFRAHGSRKENEVWSFGKQAEPILEKYLRLRYQLMPYLYSLGYYSHQTGAPFMRGLFMDFGSDPKVANLGDEYMFGPALLIAPVTEQGRTSRSVYLPAGADWFNFWTNERLHGGQTIQANAPIDIIPIFVRSGSILPLGSSIESTDEHQSVASVRVYSGSDGDFTLYDDDGKTYAYEQGKQTITHLHWSDADSKLTQNGSTYRARVEVIGR